MEPKYVVILQCDIVHNRCSGFACTKTFYNRAESFAGYPEDIPYLSFTCGGCCGKGVAAKLEHFANKLAKQTDYQKDDVVIHLSSCMTNDHHHSNRCPHTAYIKEIIAKHGFRNVVEGTYISKTSTKLREMGKYKTY